MRDWLGIDGEVGKPEPEHPKRPIEGFQVRREEVSGNRFWGWARDRFGSERVREVERRMPRDVVSQDTQEMRLDLEEYERRRKQEQRRRRGRGRG